MTVMASRRSAWTSIFWAAMVLVLIETALTLSDADRLAFTAIGLPRYIAGFSVAIVLTIVFHLGLVFALMDWLQRRGRSRTEVLLVAAACFGFAWHVTLVQRDGIRSLDHYWLLRTAIALAFAGGLSALCYFFLCRPIASDRWRRVLVFLGVGVAVFVNQGMLLSYRQFHGYLATLICILLAWLFYPWMRRGGWQKAALALGLVVLTTTFVLAEQREFVEGHVRRLTRVAGPLMETLPISNRLLLPTEKLIDPDMAVEQFQREAIARKFKKRSERAVPSASGKNVVLIVLESTRSDFWAEPKLTPEFHKWKRFGVYAPTAIAQYPATPLAYGAMFTGQYPSVLAQSPHWARHRLFDVIADRFDEKILTRPKNKWFDYSSISAFFLKDDIPQNKHRSAPEALSFAKGKIQAALEKEKSFFAWIHLYEPHAPYSKRKEFPFGSSVRARYRGEIAWLDQRMGPFMEWLLDSDFSKETLVLVIGDHGEGLGERVFGERFVGHHVHVNTLVSHVPFFMAGPGIPRNVMRGGLRPAQIDIMPTIFEFMGAAVPARYKVQGVPVQAQLKKPPKRGLVTEAFAIRGRRFFKFFDKARDLSHEEMRVAFAEMNKDDSYAPKLGLEYGDLKFTYDTWLRRGWVYNLARDPREMKDLSEKEPKTMTLMEKKLTEWRRTQAWVLDELAKLDLRQSKSVAE